jgi:hypothetical protein
MISTMSSPFVYEEPVNEDALVGRGEELQTLGDRALDGRNSRIQGPRRFGKTSLLRAALAQAERDGAISIEVNFLGCVTAADVAERIERAYGSQLDSRLRRWFAALTRTLQPTVSAAPGGIGVRAEPKLAAPGLLDRLALPRRIQERTGKQCVIAFDEFQEVVRIDAALPGVFRSELESHGKAAGYLFSGSHPGLMRQLLSSSSDFQPMSSASSSRRASSKGGATRAKRSDRCSTPPRVTHSARCCWLTISTNT